MEVDEVVDRHTFSLAVLVCVGADDTIAGPLGFLLYAVEHGGIVVGDQVGHDDANDLRCLLAQALREGVGPVVQALGQFLHTLLHLLAYLRRRMQRSADSGNTDIQFLCQVLQRYPVLGICHNIILGLQR